MKKKLLIVLLLVLALFTGCTKLKKKVDKDAVKIRESEAKSIKIEKYDNGLVSFNKPVGWSVEVAKVDYIHYSFKVFDPKNPDFMFFFGLKQEGFLKTEKARSTYAKYYPKAMFSKLAAVDPQTTEGFYKVWNQNAKLSNSEELKTNYFPIFNSMEKIDNLGKTTLGGDIVRYKYLNDKKATIQGLFTATVMSSGTYYINTNIFSLTSPKVDVAPLNVYNIIFMTAPDSDFNEWQPVLDNCLGSIVFSDAFIKGFNQQEANLVKTIKANQKIYDSISDMIMDSWEKRNNSYDIISQKRSDATLGYERVYNTDTGEIYKAYNGFTDEYKGSLYKPITDDMYTKPTSGYIEK